MREKGELDTRIYDKIKSNKTAIKAQGHLPRDFPAKHDEIKYPDQGLNIGSMLYRTSNMNYGSK